MDIYIILHSLNVVRSIDTTSLRHKCAASEQHTDVLEWAVPDMAQIPYWSLATLGTKVECAHLIEK